MQEATLDATDPDVRLGQGNGEGPPENGARAQGSVNEAFARNLLDALIRFRDGDFGSRMPADLVGVQGKIADVFNDILAVSARRTAETARVCRMVGKEGKTKERLRVPGAAGGWADEVTALNTLIDDLVWPTTEVTRAVGAVAKGDLTQAMALDVDGRPLEGEFLRSARSRRHPPTQEAINTMVDQLRAFASEVTRVAREGLHFEAGEHRSASVAAARLALPLT